MIDNRIAYFDVCTREPSPSGDGLTLRRRVNRIQDQLTRILRFAEANRQRVVSTPCLHASPIESVLPKTACFVTYEAETDSLKSDVEQAREIFLEKRGCGSAEDNMRCRAFDVFHANPNAARVIQWIDVPHWIVFGTSMEYCVQSAAESLLKKFGRTVTVLQDAVVNGPGGDDAKRESLQWLESQGATLLSTDDFLRQHA